MRQVPATKDFALFARWPILNTIGSIDRAREIGDAVEESQEFFIASLPCRVRAISHQLRSRLNIEISQRHVLDIILAEDANGISEQRRPGKLFRVSPPDAPHHAAGHYHLR